MSATPSIVLAAFAPETELELTLEATLILEALDCGFITGSHTPGIRDALLALLAMTDLPALKAARKRGTIDELLETAGRSRKPSALLAMVPAIAEAVRLATDPAAAAEPLDDDDNSFISVEKKSAPAAAGG